MLGWLFAVLLFGVVVLQGVVLLVMIAALQSSYDAATGLEEKHVAGDSGGRNKIAILSLTGVIMEGDGLLKRQIDRVRKDDAVKAAVLRIDSPGGTVTGSDYLYHHLTKLKRDLRDEGRDLPLVVSMGGIAASGGYYIAMAVEDAPQSIFAEPTTTTGSIGVIIPHYDISGLLSEYDIEDDSITNDAGKYKQLLSMSKSMDPNEEGISEEEAERRREVRKILKEYVNQSFDRFKQIVRDGRPNMSDDALDAAATGQIFTAEQAKDRGLVDRIGFVEDAVDRAVEMANLNADDVQVVKYESPPTLLTALGVSAPQPRTSRLEMLLDLTTPRAYYLATWLPGVVVRGEN
jgi:protease-4